MHVQRNKDQKSTINPILVCLLAKTMKSLVIEYIIERRKIARSKDVVIHEHETLADFDHSRKSIKLSTGAT